MIKIGITGSIASGKTTASKIISNKRGPLFCADSVVKKLYKNKEFKATILKKFSLKLNSNLKKELRSKILHNKQNLIKLEKIIHPLVRKEMFFFIKKNKYKKFLFFEIPLLIENKLSKNFDAVIFVKSLHSLRLLRYRINGGNSELFSLFNSHQLKDAVKAKVCSHVVVNNKSLFILKKNLSNIMKLYE
tara:strand:+ start:782 stop:1348 length:567 start_codon:yes stop_codon:yes gene_type:complete